MCNYLWLGDKDSLLGVVMLSRSYDLWEAGCHSTGIITVLIQFYWKTFSIVLAIDFTWKNTGLMSHEMIGPNYAEKAESESSFQGIFPSTKK